MAGFGAYVVSCSGTNTSIEAKRLIADALIFAESAGDPETRISTLQDAAHAASLLSGDFAHAIDVQRMVLAMTIEIGDRAREAASRQKLGLALWFSWEIDEAIAQASEALALCESLRLGDLRARAMGSLGCYLLDVDLKKARDWCRRASEAALEMGSMWTAIVQTNNSTESSWLLGDISAMAEDLARVDPMQRGFELALTHAASANRARYLRCIGDYDASLRILEELAAALPSESSIEAAELRDDLATTYLACGRTDEARAAIESSVLVARGAARKRQDELRHHWLDACVHHAANQSDDAKRALESAHDVYSGRLARLRDPAYRASFAAMPLHRALFAARERDEWPEPNSPCVVAFPFAGSRSASIA
jgi:tetratricopeptide (TPR) repeat protein